MNVGSILRSKGTHVETASTGTTLRDAAMRLADKKIGSLVILDEANKRVVGVLAERDLVRAFAERGTVAFGLPVKAILTGTPATCTPDDSVDKVLTEMTRRRTRHLPVMSAGVLIGIVSLGDAVKRRLDNLQLELGVLRDHVRVRFIAS
ncbi:MAG: CBS domain-containing protein [Myxococcota bacterium]